MKTTLAHLADAGDSSLVRITEVSGAGAVAWRLREVGFCSGAEVRFVRRAPLGDPAMYEIRGALLSLRRNEARRIRVRRIET